MRSFLEPHVNKPPVDVMVKRNILLASRPVSKLPCLSFLPTSALLIAPILRERWLLRCAFTIYKVGLSAKTVFHASSKSSYKCMGNTMKN